MSPTKTKKKKSSNYKRKAGAIAFAAVGALALSGCAGTAFNGLPDWNDPVASEQFCTDREQAGVTVDTVGFFADLTIGTALAPLANIVKSVGLSEVKNNPTTLEINKECSQYWSE